VKARKAMIERDITQLSVRRQCRLLAVNRNRLDPPSPASSEEDLAVCRLLDEIHLEAPAFGSRKIRDLLEVEYDRKMSRGRVRRLMRVMGVQAVYRRPRTSLPGKGDEHKVYPYLLGEREITEPDEAWCTDITYIPMGRSFAYLVAVMDWRTRAVLSWKLSNTMDTGFCVDAFQEAVKVAGRAPEIFNTDQGSQFTAKIWRDELESHGVRISMDGKGCWVDNVFIERLWRTVKYEEIYLREYRDLHELERALERWFERYNTWRPHDALGGARPWEVYRPDEPEQEAA
jgi:putative transposase